MLQRYNIFPNHHHPSLLFYIGMEIPYIPSQHTKFALSNKKLSILNSQLSILNSANVDNFERSAHFINFNNFGNIDFSLFTFHFNSQFSIINSQLSS